MKKITIIPIKLLVSIIVGFVGFFFLLFCVFSLGMEPTITSLGVLVAIIALLLTSHYQIKTNQTEGLMHAFKKLNDPDHRKNRGIIFRTYARYNNNPILHSCDLDFEKKNEDLPDQRFPVCNLSGLKNEYLPDQRFHIFNPDLEKKLKDAMEEVRSDLDEIGSMLNHGLLPREPLLEVYWGTIIRSWVALYGNIRFTRKNILSGYFMKYFQELAYEAWQYWKNNLSEKPIKFY